VKGYAHQYCNIFDPSSSWPWTFLGWVGDSNLSNYARLLIYIKTIHVV
jgi:hypothetical protein